MTDVLIKKSEVQETVKQKLRDIQSIEETYSKKGCDPFTAVMGLARCRSREKKQIKSLNLVLLFLQFSNVLLQLIKYYFMYKVHIMNKYNQKSDTSVHPIHQK